ncbi:hypothetical protein R0D99_03025 [Ottowia sp. SB7-C50]|nr:hypothetical protein [Ottowia sp. SB7-C50]WOP16045.1 hypothetical protein R0D99_03025 [Ottowia sp. SB7-C50]
MSTQRGNAKLSRRRKGRNTLCSDGSVARLQDSFSSSSLCQEALSTRSQRGFFATARRFPEALSGVGLISVMDASRLSSRSMRFLSSAISSAGGHAQPAQRTRDALFEDSFESAPWQRAIADLPGDFSHALAGFCQAIFCQRLSLALNCNTFLHERVERLAAFSVRFGKRPKPGQPHVALRNAVCAWTADLRLIFTERIFFL